MHVRDVRERTALQDAAVLQDVYKEASLSAIAPGPLFPLCPLSHLSYTLSPLLDSDIEGQCLSSEFKEDGYRAVNRFKGLDYCHGATAPFHVGDYHLFETLETDWFKVEAVVHFGSNCEGARTWVHRGALGALMDDAANFAGYCVSGELNLFSGFTR